MHAPMSFCDLPVELGVEVLEYLRGDRLPATQATECKTY